MELNTYIQQIKFNGSTYTKGSVVDLLDKFHIICKDFPFKKNPELVDLPERVWEGADGADVYVPDTIPAKHYSLDVEFLYTRKRGGGTTDSAIRADINNFISFICGRVGSGATGDTMQSSRLAIFNEYVSMGRKDVVVSKIDNNIYFFSDNDDDVVASFKVTFKVYDPTKEVTLTKNQSGKVTDLSWA